MPPTPAWQLSAMSCPRAATRRTASSSSSTPQHTAAAYSPEVQSHESHGAVDITHVCWATTIVPLLIQHANSNRQTKDGKETTMKTQFQGRANPQRRSQHLATAIASGWSLWSQLTTHERLGRLGTCRHLGNEKGEVNTQPLRGTQRTKWPTLCPNTATGSMPLSFHISWCSFQSFRPNTSKIEAV